MLPTMWDDGELQVIQRLERIEDATTRRIERLMDELVHSRGEILAWPPA
jgi:hypothetical protein